MCPGPPRFRSGAGPARSRPKPSRVCASVPVLPRSCRSRADPRPSHQTVQCVCTVRCKSFAHAKVSLGTWPIQFERPWSGDPTTGHNPPLTYVPLLGFRTNVSQTAWTDHVQCFCNRLYTPVPVSVPVPVPVPVPVSVPGRSAGRCGS